MTQADRAALPLAAALFAVTAWGLTAPITKIAVHLFDPLAVAVLRTALAGVATVPLALAMRLRLPSNATHWSLLLASAFCAFVAFPLLYCVGLQSTTAARSVLIMAGMPVLTGLYAALFERRWPVRRWWLGSSLALLGEVLLIGDRPPAGGAGDGTPDGTPLGDALIVLAALTASFGYVAGGRLQQQGYSPWATAFWGVGLSTPVVAPLLFFIPLATAPGGSAVTAWSAAGYLALVSTVIAYVAWYWALGRGGIGRMATIQFLQPVVGVIASVAWLGEALTPAMLAATAAIMAGVVIVQRR
ncbi:MAG: DMT family transporter [Alphaproteobacteria bacterium]|nr:DMT family transporter [Alphaproteobacteria bacterium]